MAVKITTAQYEAMTDAWAKTGKIAEVARAGKVSDEVAKRLVNSGDGDLPSIRSRVDRLRVISMKEEDARRVEETRIARAASRKVLNDSVQAVRDMRLIPKGTRTVAPDGTVAYECDERTYATVLGVVEKAVNLRDILDGKHERPVVGVGVQVNVDGDSKSETIVTPVPQSTPEETRRQAEDFMQQYATPLHAEQNGNAGSAARAEIISALTEATRLRA